MNIRLRCALAVVSFSWLIAAPTSSAQTVSLSPTSLSFGSVALGKSSSPLPVTLTNTGNATLTITKIAFAGTNPADFGETQNCGTTVLAGAKCTINVTFTPSAGGARSSSLTVTDNASGSPQKVSLSGTGLAPGVSFTPTSLTFANQLIGSGSAAQSITVKNTGQAPLTISGIAPAGANGADYSLTHSCGTSLAVGATCTITATFTPTAAWSRTAAIMMTDNALGSPHVMGLAGSGVSGGVASVSPSTLTFAKQLMGTTSASQSATLKNTGTAALQLAGIVAAGDYSQTNNCPSSIAVGASCKVIVTFTPSFSGARPGWINFNFTDPAGLQAVTLAGTGALPTPVLVSPKATSVTPSQTVQYTATISGVQTSNVTWSVDGVNGGDSSVGTISSAGLYTPPPAAGSHTITATNVANTKQSASVPVVVSGFSGIFTHHNDNLRTGQNSDETALTTGNVNKSQFGKLFSQPVDGQVYAQPLWVPSVNMAAQGVHNVVVVATQHDSVYAFDADQPVAALWHTSFINPSIGVTTIPRADIERGLDISPEIGITSTPVIDAANGILYVEARTKDTRGTATCPGPNNTGSPYFHSLHALDIATGAEKPGSPVMICAQVPGTGYDNYGGIVYLNTTRQNNRAGLLLLNGVVYIAFASLEDITPYHGWVLGYTYTGSAFNQVTVFNYTPNGYKAGIWHGGGGIPADASGNLYVSTGTGSFDNSVGGGISFAKLTPSGSTLNVTDYFSPFNQAYLTIEMINLDLSSSGPMLLPDQSGSVPHLAIFCGKTGTIYLVNRDNMGKFHASGDNVTQALYATIGGISTPSGNWGTPAYFNGQIYMQGVKDVLKQFGLSNDLLSGGPLAVGADIVGYPGATPAISSNGIQNGIVWVVQSDGAATGRAATLRAYDAANITHELYNTGLNGKKDVAGPAVKFAVPTVANGKVYVPTASELDVYGLQP
jgi:hypothetical protein